MLCTVRSSFRRLPFQFGSVFTRFLQQRCARHQSLTPFSFPKFAGCSPPKRASLFVVMTDARNCSQFSSWLPNKASAIVYCYRKKALTTDPSYLLDWTGTLLHRTAAARKDVSINCETDSDRGNEPRSAKHFGTVITSGQASILKAE